MYFGLKTNVLPYFTNESYLYDVAVFSTGRCEVQVAQERQSVLSRSSNFQLVCSADLAVVRSVASW